MQTHHLRINQQPFDDLVSGAKTSEVRRCDDRDFAVGDMVELIVVYADDSPLPKLSKLQTATRKITHVQRGYGLPDGLCVLSYEPLIVAEQKQLTDKWHARACEHAKEVDTLRDVLTLLAPDLKTMAILYAQKGDHQRSQALANICKSVGV